MLNNVYLFVGENKYTLELELNRWISNFLQKFGKDSVYFFNSENWDEDKVKQSVFGGGLFSDKKLVILNGLPLGNGKFDLLSASQVEKFVDEFLLISGKIPKDSLLIFVSSKPDKRAKFYKFLQTNSKVKEFPNFSEKQLENFVKEEFVGYKISNDLIKKFLAKVGFDMYRIKNEIYKLKLYCDSLKIDEISDEIVDNVVFGLLDFQVFDFLNYMFFDQKKAISLIDEMKDKGTNRNAFLGGLFRGLKTYIIVYDFIENGQKNTKEIAKETGINPYVLMQNTKKFDSIGKNGKEIKNMYKKILELEVDIKKGKKSEDVFWLEVKRLINAFKK